MPNSFVDSAFGIWDWLLFRHYGLGIRHFPLHPFVRLQHAETPFLTLPDTASKRSATGAFFEA